LLVGLPASRDEHDSCQNGGDREPLQQAWPRALRHGEEHGERRIRAGDRSDEGDGTKGERGKKRECRKREKDAARRREPELGPGDSNRVAAKEQPDSENKKASEGDDENGRERTDSATGKAGEEVVHAPGERCDEPKQN
jgi:hypothetical protein